MILVKRRPYKNPIDINYADGDRLKFMADLIAIGEMMDIGKPFYFSGHIYNTPLEWAVALESLVERHERNGYPHVDNSRLILEFLEAKGVAIVWDD